MKSCSENGKTGITFFEKLKTFFINVHVLEWNIWLANSQSKDVIGRNFAIIILTEIEVIRIGAVEIKSRLFFWQVKYLSLSLKFFVSETISNITVQPNFAIEFMIGAQIKSYS